MDTSLTPRTDAKVDQRADLALSVVEEGRNGVDTLRPFSEYIPIGQSWRGFKKVEMISTRYGHFPRTWRAGLMTYTDGVPVEYDERIAADMIVTAFYRVQCVAHLGRIKRVTTKVLIRDFVMGEWLMR